MSTHWDQQRGVSSGRCTPTTFIAPEGERCFVLGADPAREAVALSPGDYTEVRQEVDCTDLDLLVATLDTVGQVSGSYRDPGGWAADPAELWRFDGDPAASTLVNRVIPGGYPAGFPLEHVGAITYGIEPYTGGNTTCRVVPIGTTGPAALLGTHDPVAVAALTVLSEYTIQAWVRLDLDAIATSWGWDIPLVRYVDATGVADGVRLDMRGVTGAGAHGWYPYVTHYNAGSASGTAFLDWIPTASTGWMQITAVFNWAASPSTNRVRIYVNGAWASQSVAIPSLQPRTPPATGYLEIFGGNAWGAVDAVRMLDRALSGFAISASYSQAQTPGVPQATQWAMEIRVDDVVYARRVVMQDERRRWTDFVAPVRRLTGPHQVAFRLTLEGT